jgi:hypothetical protein
LTIARGFAVALFGLPYRRDLFTLTQAGDNAFDISLFSLLENANYRSWPLAAPIGTLVLLLYLFFSFQFIAACFHAVGRTAQAMLPSSSGVGGLAKLAATVACVRILLTFSAVSLVMADSAGILDSRVKLLNCLLMLLFLSNLLGVILDQSMVVAMASLGAYFPHAQLRRAAVDVGFVALSIMALWCVMLVFFSIRSELPIFTRRTPQSDTHGKVLPPTVVTFLVQLGVVGLVGVGHLVYTMLQSRLQVTALQAASQPVATTHDLNDTE